MKRSLTFLALLSFGHVAFANPDLETSAPAPRTADEVRACAGVNNEGIKTRALMRELGAYLGETIPQELAARANTHFEQIAKLKAECERLRGVTAAGASAGG